MPWIDTVSDENGYFHSYSDYAHVRRWHVIDGCMVGYLKTKGRGRLTVKWVDTQQSLKNIDQMNAITSAKLDQQAMMLVHEARMKERDVRLQKSRLWYELPKAQLGVKNALENYGNTKFNKEQMHKESISVQ
jgi:hypothetical protein